MKQVIKTFLNLFADILLLPLYALYRFLSLFGNRDGTFWAFSQALCLLPGKVGSYLRRGFYRWAMTRCDRNSTILFGTLFAQADTEIGSGVYIGPYCNIGMSRIEKDCTLGSNVHIMSGKQQHRFDDPETPIREQGGKLEKIVIGEDTWIGNGALVMAHVGRKCIIGAGSVVTKDVPDFSIVAGNPARVIGMRDSGAEGEIPSETLECSKRQILSPKS